MTIARTQCHFGMARCGQRRPFRTIVSGLLPCEFAPRGDARYPVSVAETTAIRVGSRQIPEADSRLSAVFCVRTLSAFNGRALVGVRSRTPVSSGSGLPTLPCARPPRLEAGAG